jgi:hypothetical protein
MRQLLCRVVVALCSTALVACTSLRTVHDAGAARSPPDASAAPLAAGDEVTVSMTAGSQSRLRISTVTDAFIEGTQLDSNQAEHIELAEVAKIERREFSGIKTLALVVTVYAILYAIALASASAAALSSL